MGKILFCVFLVLLACFMRGFFDSWGVWLWDFGHALMVVLLLIIMGCLAILVATLDDPTPKPTGKSNG